MLHSVFQVESFNLFQFDNNCAKCEDNLTRLQEKLLQIEDGRNSEDIEEAIAYCDSLVVSIDFVVRKLPLLPPKIPIIGRNR